MRTAKGVERSWGRRKEEEENSKTLCSNSGAEVNLSVYTDCLPRTGWRREHILYIYVLYALILPVCQPLGTIEHCCQGLCLLRHHSHGKLWEWGWLPRDEPAASSSGSLEQLFLPTECGLGLKGGQRAGGRILLGVLGLKHCSFTPALNHCLSFLRLKVGRMLIRMLSYKELMNRVVSGPGSPSTNKRMLSTCILLWGPS